MRLRNLCVAAVVVLAAASSAYATIWDAFSDFNPTNNAATNTWQYLGINDAPESDYYLLPQYGTFPFQSYSGWNAGNTFPAIGASDGEIKMQADSVVGAAAALAWMSPGAGTVTATFSLADDDLGSLGAGDHPEVPYDGVNYILYQSGNAIPLAQGYVANGGASGTISVPDIAVASGSKLYLQIRDDGYNNWYDTTAVSFTVSGTVPEPSCIMLLLSGIVGMMAYAWRRRK